MGCGCGGNRNNTNNGSAYLQKNSQKYREVIKYYKSKGQSNEKNMDSNKKENNDK